MPKNQEPKPDQDVRPDSEASALARSVMKRMLATPPKPHLAKPKKAARTPRRTKVSR